MLVIGLTGGVGAGKSTVMQLLQKQYGAYLIEADAVGRRLMKKGGITYQKILEVFGRDILDETGEIHRNRLAAVAFGTEETTLQLNACTHPYIKEAIVSEISQVRQSGGHDFLMLEAAILVQGGLTDLCDTIWYVSVPWEVRRQRIMDTRGYSSERAEDIMKRQPTEEEYLALADSVIYNNCSMEKTAAQVKELLSSLQSAVHV